MLHITDRLWEFHVASKAESVSTPCLSSNTLLTLNSLSTYDVLRKVLNVNEYCYKGDDRGCLIGHSFVSV